MGFNINKFIGKWARKLTLCVEWMIEIGKYSINFDCPNLEGNQGLDGNVCDGISEDNSL